MILHDVTNLAGCRAVVGVQEAVWGAGSEIVPASVLLVSVKRGGILVGAADAERLVGFVWSMPAVKNGALTHWSHMLGVLPAARGRGIGRRLKVAQRDRALAQGLDLIEWTFDPLQAPNAHLNLAVLGCVASTYLENAYGDMAGPLHRGTATDRLIAEWRIRTPHVTRRIDGPPVGQPIPARAEEAAGAPAAIATRTSGDWLVPTGVQPAIDTMRVAVPVPGRFTEMQERAVETAAAWRQATREAFTSYFTRGYRAVNFVLNRETGGGRYLLEQISPPDD